MRVVSREIDENSLNLAGDNFHEKFRIENEIAGIL